MNETIKELFERKSVRMYTDEKITEEEKRIILESALQAPTAGNMALYSINLIFNKICSLFKISLYWRPKISLKNK